MSLLERLRHSLNATHRPPLTVLITTSDPITVDSLVDVSIKSGICIVTGERDFRRRRQTRTLE
jgi:hypothetical protein